MRGKARLFAIVGLLGILAVACAGAQSAPTSAVGRGGEAAAQPFVDTAKGVPYAVPAPQGLVPQQQGVPQMIAADRNLILTASVQMRSKDPWATADGARTIVRGLGGDLLAMSQSGQGENRSAMLSVRVPSTQFEEALRQLKLLDGEVVSSNVDAKDVTDQFTDLKARVSAKQAEEARYLQMIPQAKTVDEMLKIESALSNVRTQIEQMQGQINSIRNRTDFSTITMSISPIAPVPGGEPVGTWDPAKTFAKATTALVAIFRVVADLAIWTVVFGWGPLLALAILMLAQRNRRTGVATS